MAIAAACKSAAGAATDHAPLMYVSVMMVTSFAAALLACGKLPSVDPDHVIGTDVGVELVTRSMYGPAAFPVGVGNVMVVDPVIVE